MVFIETPPFERLRASYLDDDQYRLLQALLVANPDVGDLIPGSGGVRKMRWTAKGKGKRGGLRVVYYWVTKREHILLLTVYHKAEVSDLTPKEIKALRALVKSLEG